MVDKKQWSEMKESEINSLKKKQCMKCLYFSTLSKNYMNSASCDYILITGKMRGCLPTECVEKGVFKGKKRRRLKSGTN